MRVSSLTLSSAHARKKIAINQYAKMMRVASLITGWRELAAELGSMRPFVVGFLFLLALMNTGQGVELIAISQQSVTTFFEQFIHSLPALLCGIVTISLLVEMRELNTTRQLHTRSGWLAKLRGALIASATPALIAHGIGMKAGYLAASTLLLIYAYFSQSDSCSKKIRRWMMVIAISLVFLAAFFVAHYSLVAQKLGTIGVVVTATTLWATLATLLFGYLPVKYFKTRPVYFFSIVVILFIAWHAHVDRNYLKKTEHGSTEPNYLDTTFAEGSSVGEHFLSWLEKINASISSEQPINVYLVTAEGGGLRASAWTTAVLAAIDTKTKGDFSKQAFAFSGVSGGSLGIGTYVACIKSIRADKKCDSSLVKQDYLAPAVARLLISEPFRLFPGASRLITSRDRSFEESLEHRNNSSGELNGLDRPFVELFNPAQQPMPIVVLNSTDATTGIRAYFSNIDLGAPNAVNVIDRFAKKYVVPTSFAIHASARFPVISPPAKIGGLELVDGGYRENTGAEEISFILNEIHSVLETSKIKRGDLKPATLPYCPPADKECEEEMLAYARNMASPIAERHERLVKLKSALARVQLHVIAITNNCYTNLDCGEYTSIDDASIGLADITSPAKAVLSSRINRTRESMLALKQLAIRKDNDLFLACSSESISTRLSKHDRVDSLIAIDGANVAEANCDFKPPRHTFHEISLINTGFTQHPPLGWVLSNETFERIDVRAKSLVDGKEAKLDWNSFSAWWEELEQELCFDTGRKRLSFDKNAKPNC